MIAQQGIVGRLLLLAVALSSFAQDAKAQRGVDFIEQEASHEELLGFPGLVDTHTLKAGELVADLPFLGLEYGITSNLSLGTNLILDLGSLSGSPSGHAQLRYRFYQKGNLKTVLDMMFAGAAIKEAGDTGAAKVGVLLVSSNSSWRFDSSSQVTLGLRAGRAITSTKNPDAPAGYEEETSLSLLAISLAYERRLTSWLHVQAAGLMVPLLVGELDSSVAAASVDIGSSVPIASRSLLRLLVNANTGSWLFSVGGVTNANASFVLPWAGIARKWK